MATLKEVLKGIVSDEVLEGETSKPTIGSIESPLYKEHRQGNIIPAETGFEVLQSRFPRREAKNQAEMFNRDVTGDKINPLAVPDMFPAGFINDGRDQSGITIAPTNTDPKDVNVLKELPGAVLETGKMGLDLATRGSLQLASWPANQVVKMLTQAHREWIKPEFKSQEHQERYYAQAQKDVEEYATAFPRAVEKIAEDLGTTTEAGSAMLEGTAVPFEFLDKKILAPLAEKTYDRLVLRQSSPLLKDLFVTGFTSAGMVAAGLGAHEAVTMNKGMATGWGKILSDRKLRKKAEFEMRKFDEAYVENPAKAMETFNVPGLLPNEMEALKLNMLNPENQNSPIKTIIKKEVVKKLSKSEAEKQDKSRAFDSAMSDFVEGVETTSPLTKGQIDRIVNSAFDEHAKNLMVSLSIIVDDAIKTETTKVSEGKTIPQKVEVPTGPETAAKNPSDVLAMLREINPEGVKQAQRLVEKAEPLGPEKAERVAEEPAKPNNQQQNVVSDEVASVEPSASVMEPVKQKIIEKVKAKKEKKAPEPKKAEETKQQEKPLLAEDVPETPSQTKLFEPEEIKIISDAFDAVQKRSGFANVDIVELAKEANLPIEDIKSFLKDEAAQGNVVLSKGDWSLSSPEMRQGAVKVNGTNYLIAKKSGKLGTKKAPPQPLQVLPEVLTEERLSNNAKKIAETYTKLAKEKAAKEINKIEVWQNSGLTITEFAEAFEQFKKEGSKANFVRLYDKDGFITYENPEATKVKLDTGSGEREVPIVESKPVSNEPVVERRTIRRKKAEVVNATPAIPEPVLTDVMLRAYKKALKEQKKLGIESSEVSLQSMLDIIDRDAKGSGIKDSDISSFINKHMEDLNLLYNKDTGNIEFIRSFVQENSTPAIKAALKKAYEVLPQLSNNTLGFMGNLQLARWTKRSAEQRGVPVEKYLTDVVGFTHERAKLSAKNIEADLKHAEKFNVFSEELIHDMLKERVAGEVIRKVGEQEITANEINEIMNDINKNYGLEKGKRRIWQKIKGSIIPTNQKFDLWSNHTGALKRIKHIWEWAQAGANREFRLVASSLARWRKSLHLNQKNMERVGDYMKSRQVGGDKYFEILGREMPKFEDLTPSEQMYYKLCAAFYEPWIERINKANALAGQKPMRIQLNYAPSTGESVLAHIGAISSSSKAQLGTWKIVNSVLRRAPELQAKIANRAKTRGKFLRMDNNAETLMMDYAHSMLNHIYKTPVAAKFGLLGKEFPVKYWDGWEGPKTYKATKTKNVNGAPTEVVETKDVKTSIAKQNYDVWHELDSYMQDAYRGTYKRYEKEGAQMVADALKKISNDASAAAIAGNASTIVNNLTTFQLLTSLDPGNGKNVALAAKDILTPGNLTKMMQESPIMGERFGAGIKNLEGLNTKYKHQKDVRDHVIDVMLLPLDAVDSYVAALSYFTGKRIAEAEGLTGRAAINRAGDFVIDTNAGGMFASKSPIQRDQVGAALTSLGTQTIQQLATVVHNIAGIGNSDISKKRGAWQTLKLFMTLGIVNSVYKNIFNMQSPGAMPIDEFIAAVGAGDSKAEAALKASMEFLEYVPIIGNMRKFGFGSYGGIGINTIEGAVGAKQFDYTIGDLLRDANKKGMSKEKALYKFVTSDQFTDIGRALKIPVGPFAASLKQIVEQKEGKVKRSILSRITGKNAADRREKQAKKGKYNPKILEDSFQLQMLKGKVLDS